MTTLAAILVSLLVGLLIALKWAVSSKQRAELRAARKARRRPRAVVVTPPPSPQFLASAAFLHLAVLVCTADDQISPAERKLLEEHLARAQVTRAERGKLQEQLAKMLAQPPKFWGIKKRLSLLDATQQATIADLLIGVAGVDGQVGPDELRMLGRIYPKLGLATEDVYSRVHAMSTGAPAQAPAGPSAPVQRVQLNMATVQAKLAQSAEVSALLGDIFAEDEEPSARAPAAVAAAAAPATTPAPPAPVAWASSPHGMLLARLAQRPVWTRKEFDAVAAELRLLPDGAIDALNEAAFDRAGGPVLEGDDPIHVDLTTARTLLA